MGKITDINTTQEPTDVIDIDLSAIQKKRFRINGDNSKILELNVSDLSIVNRLNDTYVKLDKLTKNAQSIAAEPIDTSASEEDQLKAVAEFGVQLKSIDTEMRDLLDNLFNAPVSEVCAPDGSMYDVFGGQFRYEHILDVLSKLYSNNFNEEFKRAKQRIAQKTQKYTKSTKSTKKRS